MTRLAPPSKYPRKKRGRIANLPVTIRFGLPIAALVIFVIWGMDSATDTNAVLRVFTSESVPLQKAHIELFKYEPAASHPSPSAKIGDYDLSDGTLTLGWDDTGGAATLARVSAEGYGIGFVLVEQGDNRLTLGEASSATGRIHAPPALLAGAKVQAFGGGARGVLLLETETDAQGAFILEGFSNAVSFLLVRVFQAGFAVAEFEWEVDGRNPLELTLESTQPLVGEIEYRAEYGSQPVEIRAYHVPGVQTWSDKDGKFRFEHLPPEPIRIALLLSSLPKEFTHRRVQAMVTDKPIKIPILRSATVRGRVINGNNDRGIPGAKVVHAHGPNGHEVVECGADGSFEIGRLPFGEVRLDADIMIMAPVFPGKPDSPKRLKLIQGHVELDLIEGETLESVVITVY